MIVDKIYSRYEYRGNWFVIARLKYEDGYVTRSVMMSEKKAKTIRVGDTI